ncbi:Multiple myeloma tumor-associated protein 2 [Grifola frondosa]|uniref:Multiple myeloma tumor-associated protein 2 n=1 Tax=Grifola frondosa TaxID=5627 RepID=A0A1C7M2G7_GRIFR|nr:Multiple myeloma tumor-associated protein 2 [Grifola frondosa]
MFEPVRGGTRGGQAEFKWSDVSADKDRENYLGHSINAPTGRWQKNKDVHWYARDVSQGEAERREEIRKIKEAEAEALAAALGFAPGPKTATSSGPGTGPNAIGVAPKPNAADAGIPLDEEKEERKRRKAERKEEKRAKKEKRRVERERVGMQGAKRMSAGDMIVHAHVRRGEERGRETGTAPTRAAILVVREVGQGRRRRAGPRMTAIMMRRRGLGKGSAIGGGGTIVLAESGLARDGVGMEGELIDCM